MSSRDINIRAVVTAVSEKAAAVVTKSMTTIRKQVDMVDQKLTTHNKMVRRMANSNKKAFNLAALSTGPLIRAYAEVAASMWAIERTWSAIEMGAKFEETANSFEVLAKTFGFSSRVIISNLRAISGETVSTSILMKNASLALSSGIDPKQLEGLTKVARQAARAMGRTMPDAYDRIIKAVTKLEPELLDEIGITTRLQNILGDYAKTVGKTVDKITSLEKTQIFTNAVLAEGTKKFGSLDLATASYAERMSKLKSDLVNFATVASGMLAHVFVPLAETIQASSTVISAGIALWAAYRLRIVAASKATVVATSIERAQTVAKEAHTAAIITLEKALAAEEAITKLDSAATKEKAASDVIAARASLGRAAATQASTKASVIAISTNKALAKSLALIGKAVPYIGWAVTAYLLFGDAVASAAESMGLIDKATISTEEKLNKLTVAQKTLMKHSNSLGVSQDQLINSLFDGQTKLKDYGDGFHTFTAKVKDANGVIREHTVLLDTNGKAVVRSIRLQKAMSEAIDANQKIIADSNTVWSRWSAFITGNTDIVEANRKRAQSRIADILTYNDKETKSLKDLSIANTKLSESYNNVDFALKQLGVTKGSLLAKTSSEKMNIIKELLDQAKSVNEAQILASAGSDAEIKKALNRAKELKSLVPGLTAELHKLQEAAARKNKAPKSSINADEAGAKRALDTLTGTKAEQTQVIADSKAFHSNLLDAQDMYFAEQQARAVRDLTKNAITEEQYNARILAIDLSSNKARLSENADFAKRNANLQKKQLSALASNDDNAINDRVQALKDSNDIVLASKKLSLDEQLALVKDMNAKIKTMTDKETLKSGSMFDILAMKFKNAAESAKSSSELLANSFISMGDIISTTLKDKVMVALGLSTDDVKAKFAEQLAAAQASYKGMLAAANQAFSGDVGKADLKSKRSLQDLETSRVRKISDLTAGRNNGSLTDQQFGKGKDALSLSVSRKTEDIGTTNARGKEDAKSKKAKSLLEAQKKLNEDMLAANAQFASDNQTIWSDMYGAIKDNAISTAIEIAMNEFKAMDFSIKSKEEGENLKQDLESKGATASLGTKVAKMLAGVGIDLPEILSSFSAMLGPFGPPLAAVAMGAVGALASSVVAKAIPMKSISGGSLSAPKFHTGGTMGGASEEIPFIGLKGEGVLNRHNGMKAVGGSKGLDHINSTGTMPTSGGVTNVTIEVKANTGETTGSLTINNFESFLRNQGGKQMRKVSRDGTILMSTRGIA